MPRQMGPFTDLDPDPTQPVKRCEVKGCPCFDAHAAGEKLLGAANYLALMDVEHVDRKLIDVLMFEPRHRWSKVD